VNKERRERIKKVIGTLDGCSEDLSLVKDEEDDMRENIPENLQGGEAYCESEEYSDKIEEALSDIQSAIDSLEEI